jgi:hypothetical protein
MVMTLVWYPWTEGQGGPVGTEGAFRTLDLEIRGASWPRLPGVGETIFFDDGGSAAIEAVGWKLDGTSYLYLGKRYEKRGDMLPAWLARGFKERATTSTLLPPPTAPRPDSPTAITAPPPSMPQQPAQAPEPPAEPPAEQPAEQPEQP